MPPLIAVVRPTSGPEVWRAGVIVTDDEVLERLESLLAGVELAGPVESESVAVAEAKLGVVLPRSYKVFLRRYGACLKDGFEVAGIDPARVSESETPYWTDVVSLNANRRRDGIPETLVFVSDDGCDYSFCLDTSARDADGECPVVVLGPGIHYGRLADNFLEFVARAVRGDLFVGPPWEQAAQ